MHYKVLLCHIAYCPTKLFTMISSKFTEIIWFHSSSHFSRFSQVMISQRVNSRKACKQHVHTKTPGHGKIPPKPTEAFKSQNTVLLLLLNQAKTILSFSIVCVCFKPYFSGYRGMNWIKIFGVPFFLKHCLSPLVLLLCLLMCNTLYTLLYINGSILRYKFPLKKECYNVFLHKTACQFFFVHPSKSLLNIISG